MKTITYGAGGTPLANNGGAGSEVVASNPQQLWHEQEYSDMHVHCLQPSTDKPVIVCAAIRHNGWYVICGVRHFDELMQDEIELREETGMYFYDDRYEQGFIDQFGKFLTRTEAWKVAVAANQIKFRVGGDTLDGGTLYSENLY